MTADVRLMTIADLEAMPDDGNRYELIDGVIYMLASPSWRHSLTVSALNDLLKGWVRPRGLGVVHFAPLDVMLDDESVVQPDLLFIERREMERTAPGRYRGHITLAVEVLSPTNSRVDRVTKLYRYGQAGIPEYWIVDPEGGEFLLLSLHGRMYRPIEPGNDGKYRSLVLPGLVVDPATIFSEVDELMPFGPPDAG